MVDYLRRPAELIARIDELGPQIPEAERGTMRNALVEYLVARKSALDDLGRILDDMNPGDKDSVWRDRVKRARDDTGRFFDNSLSGTSAPSTVALGFRALMTNAELTFWGGLEEMGVAKKRDEIAAARAKIEKMAGELDEKWRTIDGVDEMLWMEQRNVIRDVKRLMQEAIEETAKSRRTAMEGIAKIAVMVTDWPKSLPGPASVRLTAELIRKSLQHYGPELLKMTLFAMSALKDFLKPWEKVGITIRSAQYENLLTKEAAVHVLFTQTWRDTQDFAKNNGFEAAKALYGQARESLDRWSGNLPSGGVREDAEAFAKYCLEQLSWSLARTEASFNDFVNRHKGKFFGAMSDEIKESLGEFKAWETELSEVRQLDLETKLRQYHDEANVFFLVDLEGSLSWPEQSLREREDLSSADKSELIGMYRAYADEIRRQIKAECSRIADGLKQAQRGMSQRELDEAFKRAILIGNLPQ